mmetsp:Transcript_27704/g.73105  ORF Transcript_27704/g.73105 Transcript_27704/m.73105 type:complete len:249 (+) Transcript_27704:287-1033(+)
MRDLLSFKPKRQFAVETLPIELSEVTGEELRRGRRHDDHRPTLANAQSTFACPRRSCHGHQVCALPSPCMERMGAEVLRDNSYGPPWTLLCYVQPRLRRWGFPLQRCARLSLMGLADVCQWSILDPRGPYVVPGVRVLQIRFSSGALHIQSGLSATCAAIFWRLPNLSSKTWTVLVVVPTADLIQSLLADRWTWLRPIASMLVESLRVGQSFASCWRHRAKQRAAVSTILCSVVLPDSSLVQFSAACV